MKRLNILLLLLLAAAAWARAENTPAPIPVGIVDKLGSQIPLETQFYDEKGYLVSLKEVINKPTILNLVYFKCPGLCSPILTELTSIVNKIDMQIGRDYQIVTISFDENEKPDLAEQKRENYMSLVNRTVPDNAWKFMTGDSASIHAVTNAAGFYFRREGGQFLHAGAIIVLTPDGKVTRYLYGTQYLPFDVKMAIVEASEGRTGPTITKLLKFCYSYSPEGRTYVMNVSRIVGAVTLVVVGAFVMFLTMKPKKRQAQA
jgi:protein SCO1